MEALDLNLEKRSLSEQLFDHIKDLILSDKLKCGERIPEVKIASAFGVSRTPIREALRKLEKYGLVKIYPRSHATVVEIDENESAYIEQVRLQIETAAVRLLAEHATPEDCTVLKNYADLCEKYIKENNIAACFEYDGILHLEIAKRSGNPYFYSILHMLDAKIQLIRTKYCTHAKKIAFDIKDHYPLVKAICNNKPDEAEEIMRKHVRQTHKISEL